MEHFWKLHTVKKLLPKQQQQLKEQTAHGHDISRKTATSASGSQQSYTQTKDDHYQTNNNSKQEHQQQQHEQRKLPHERQHYAHSATIQLQQQKQQQQPYRAPLRLSQKQLTSAAAAVDNFRLSVLYALVATSASAFTYNMHSICASVTPEAEPTTLELKRDKAPTTQPPHYGRLLHATPCGGVGSGSGLGSLDSRSIFYLSLLLLIYCGVLIRASAATTPTIPLENKTNALEPYELRQLAATAAAGLDVRNVSAVANAAPAFAPTAAVADTVAAVAVTDDNVVAAGNDRAADRPAATQQRVFKRGAANVPDDEDDSAYHDDEFDEYDALINNKSAKGKYIGAPCYNDMTCEPTLLHVKCDKETHICGCEKNYPVQLGLTKGCAKPKKLGEQCFYDETCIYSDENSLCVQVRHNALCQCASGFHSVSYTKPTRRVFCTQDLNEMNSDLPTLLGVSTGIAVLAGLICMVLHLFSKTKYPRHRNFGDANLPPPIMYSSDTGIPLTVQSGRPSSRSSLRSSGSIGSYGNRRASSGGAAAGTGAGAGAGAGGAKGILVSTSRTGSRRPSLASVHSTSSSVRSYSMMRFEKEAQQKEIRQEMKLRLARLQQQQHLNQNKPQIVIGDALHHGAAALSRLSNMPTPSPMTPNSTDELLPAVDELQEYPLKLEATSPLTTTSAMRQESAAAATLSAIRQVAGTAASQTVGAGVAPTMPAEIAAAAAYIGPCSSSTEAL